MTGWPFTETLPAEVENAEDAYNDFARKAEAAPHKWGEEQTSQLARMADTLRVLYEKHNVAESDRICL